MSTELETLRGELHAISSIDNRNDDDRAERLADVFAGKYVDGCIASESEIVAVRKTLAYCNDKFIEPLQLRIANETAQRRQVEAERDALRAQRQEVLDGMSRAITAEGAANKAYYYACAERDKLRSRVAKLEEAAAFVYNAVLASSVCKTKCECIDCDILETLGEQLGIPTIGET